LFFFIFNYSGIPPEELRKELAEIRHKAEVKAAGLFAYVYTSDNEHFNLQREAHKLFDGWVLFCFIHVCTLIYRYSLYILVSINYYIYIRASSRLRQIQQDTKAKKNSTNNKARLLIIIIGVASPKQLN
jgi:hypothetical protein